MDQVEIAVAEILTAFEEEQSLLDIIKLSDKLDEEELLTLSFGENSFLNLAVSYDKISLVMYILEKGADINRKDASGSTALHIAVTNGLVCMTRYLLLNLANPNIVNEDMLTPLDLALDGLIETKSSTYKKIILLLLDKGAAIGESMSNYSTDNRADTKMLSLLEAYGGVINEGTQEPRVTQAWKRNKSVYKLIEEDLIDRDSEEESSDEDIPLSKLKK